MDYAFALALAAALLDVTLGLHAPSRGLEIWLRIVRGAAGGPLGVALYFAPVGVAAAAVAQSLPEGPLGPAARLGALALALAAWGAPRLLRLVIGQAARPTAPAEAVMLAALGPLKRDAPDYLRRALALCRRAAAIELFALAALTLFAFLGPALL